MRLRFTQEVLALLDWLLPPVCVLCAAPAPLPAGFCRPCREAIVPLPPARCPCCALPYPSENGSVHLCESCLRTPPPFQTTVAGGIYEGTLRHAIHRFKFDGTLHLERPFTALLAEALATGDDRWRPSLLIPVPLHRRRLQQRGFNQTLLLARGLGKQLRIPVAHHTLIRTRPTPPQPGLRVEERHRNLHGAFALRQPVPGERVLLLDDVMTTGATARECAAVLLAGGAAEVHVAVLARAPRHAL